MKIFFGKISQELEEQHEMNFYAAGKMGSPWYNGLEPGDYVFPIFKGKVIKLWKVREYGPTPVTKKKFDANAVLFDEVKKFPVPVPLSSRFCRYKYFDVDLTLINKSAKSTAMEQKGFYEISVSEEFPEPENVNLMDSRNVVIALASAAFHYDHNDIRIILEQKNQDYTIKDIEIFKNGSFLHYDILWRLYDKKNETKYSLNTLLEYAKEDEATKKEKYLNNVISDVDEQGYFIVSSPIALYDDILVGRKVSKKKKESQDEIPPQDNDDSIEDEMDIQRFEKYHSYVDLLHFNPNLILYGPPGTGKTFAAQRIIEAFEYKLTKDPTVSFNTIKKDGRVEFITFHQSYSYEEFVEGLRPIIHSDNDAEVTGINYEIKPGILRKIANNASLDVLKDSEVTASFQQIKKESKIYKVSLGLRLQEDKVYQQCKSDNVIAIGWLNNTNLSGKDYHFIFQAIKNTKPEDGADPTNDASSVNMFVNDLQIGDIVFIYEGPYTIRDIGIIESNYMFDASRGDYSHYRKVKWIKEFGDKPFDISSYNANVRLTLKTIYPLNRITFDDVVSIIGDESDMLDRRKKGKPFYILIDEINRGNISKIFGELITLIEKDKRDTLKLTLPYSQKPFTLPSNLFFIGTMNTADRSIAILDTALRRRFVFKELEPDPEVINEVGDNPLIEGKIDLSQLLAQMNQRIEREYDRDHRIGHSYFLNATNIKSLRQVWYYQILPLLQEYFYNDGEKVVKIVGSKFVNRATSNVDYSLSNDAFTEELMKLSRDE